MPTIRVQAGTIDFETVSADLSAPPPPNGTEERYLYDLRRYDYRQYEIEMIRRQQEERYEQMRRAEREAAARMAESIDQQALDSMRYSAPAIGNYTITGANFASAGTTLRIEDLNIAYSMMNDSSFTSARYKTMSAQQLIEKMHALFCVGLCNYCAGENKEKVEALASSVV